VREDRMLSLTLINPNPIHSAFGGFWGWTGKVHWKRSSPRPTNWMGAAAAEGQLGKEGMMGGMGMDDAPGGSNEEAEDF
jgi:hypothetical protein